jgi:hypothetical protein
MRWVQWLARVMFVYMLERDDDSRLGREIRRHGCATSGEAPDEDLTNQL